MADLDLRVTGQHIGFRHFEAREYGRGAEGGARLPATFGAVADIERQWLRERRLEPDGPALTAGFHHEISRLFASSLFSARLIGMDWAEMEETVIGVSTSSTKLGEA